MSENNITEQETPQPKVIKAENAISLEGYSLEKLQERLQKIIKTDKISDVRQEAEAIKEAFYTQYDAQKSAQKEVFLQDKNNNEIDFGFHLPIKSSFDKLYNDYRKRLKQDRISFEKSMQENYKKKLDIIEQIKQLVTLEENIGSTFRTFQELRQQWNTIGPVPKINMDDLWKTYHHHVDIFYDYLDLNRELRDKEFSENLTKKQKLIQKATELATETNLPKAFREVRFLHKAWREQIGPVGKEHRERIWEEFNQATKIVLDKKGEYQKQLDQASEANAQTKKNIIQQMNELLSNTPTDAKQWKQLNQQVEQLREQYLQVGKVDNKLNKALWKEFNDTLRNINREKNKFYKSIKNTQLENLDKKKALIKTADSLKDNEEWEETSEKLIQLQKEWKLIGHVPYKHSDTIWEEFRAACNHFFDRMKAKKNEATQAEQNEALEKKNTIIEQLSTINDAKDIDDKQRGKNIQTAINNWLKIGYVPIDKKKEIEATFDQKIQELIAKISDKELAEKLQYKNKMSKVASTPAAMMKEKEAINKKLSTVSHELNTLENNMSFLNTSKTNPLIVELSKKIDDLKEQQQKLENDKRMINQMERDSRPKDKEE